MIVNIAAETDPLKKARKQGKLKQLDDVLWEIGQAFLRIDPLVDGDGNYDLP